MKQNDGAGSCKGIHITAKNNRIDITFPGTQFMCHCSLLAAGDQRPSVSANNRNAFFAAQGIASENILYLTQIHSKKIFLTDSAAGFNGCEGDGIITQNKFLVPSVLVADCMPIFVICKKSGAFGVLHSGWRGTGIAVEALNLLHGNFGSKPSDVYFVFGPHIRQCCYNVDKARAAVFKSMCKKSVGLSLIRLLSRNRYHYRLSLAEANKRLLLNAGVPDTNIYETGLCTCCTHLRDLPHENGVKIEPQTEYAFGSNRRENKTGDDAFTRMTAYIRYNG